MSITFWTTHDNDTTLNVSNRNAVRLLALLGYDRETCEDNCGSDDAEAFLGRVLVALSLVDVSTADRVGTPGHWEGRIYEGGHYPGYFQDRLEELEEVAQAARRRGTEVTWG